MNRRLTCSSAALRSAVPLVCLALVFAACASSSSSDIEHPGDEADGGNAAPHADGGAGSAPDGGSPAPDGAVPKSDSGASSGDAALPMDAALPGWKLTWSDEFNTADGTQPDPTKWSYDLGDGTSQGAPGWGNTELQYYTDKPANAAIHAGSLVITAMKSSDATLKCSGAVCGYTSARIHTQGKFSQTYGRFEARIKLPFGSGVWPAFWMMGDKFTQANWPKYGEIDVMENAGSLPSEVRGSVHGPGGNATYTDEGITAPHDLPAGTKVSDDFHVFAVEWDVDTISFFFDDAKYLTVVAADVVAKGQGATWPFNNDPCFILLNFAVDSGNFGKPPNAQTVWPQHMLVDYVRVYEKG